MRQMRSAAHRLSRVWGTVLLKAKGSCVLPGEMPFEKNATGKGAAGYNRSTAKGRFRWAHSPDARSSQLNEMDWLSTMRKASKSRKGIHWSIRLGLALQSSVSVVSIYLLRCVLVLALGLSIPQEVVSADATFLAVMYMAYSTIDAVSAMLIGRNGIWLQRAFWLSSLWLAMLAVEQVCNMDLLQSVDAYANLAGEVIIIMALGWGIRECWRSAQQ